MMTVPEQGINRRDALRGAIMGSAALAMVALTVPVRAQTMPDTSANEALIRRHYGLFPVADLMMFDTVLAPDYVDHPLAGPPGFVGSQRDAFKASVLGFRAVFADIQFTLDDVIAAGDKVVGRWSFVGTHVAPLAGVPPTGKQVQFRAVDIHRVADGIIAESWHIEDYLGFFLQSGFPMPTPTT